MERVFAYCVLMCVCEIGSQPTRCWFLWCYFEKFNLSVKTYLYSTGTVCHERM